MNRFYYDLHVHSCLSPCADDDMTPQNIVGMCALKGLQIVALTDHNSTKNCRVFCDTAKEYGICGIPGVELTTSEDIHMLCLFPSVEVAEEFEVVLESKRIMYKNKPEIFGHQYIVDENEVCLETIPYLLSYAVMLSVDEAIEEVHRLGGFICPAHVDRTANGMIGILGTVPAEYRFSCIEFKEKSKAEEISAAHGLSETIHIFDSDAHYLGDISEPVHFLELPFENPTPKEVISYLLK